MNIPPRELKGFYTYSLRVGAKLCFLVSVRSLQLLRRCKISLMSRDLHMFQLVHDSVCLVFYDGSFPWVCFTPQMLSWTWLSPCLRPLILGIPQPRSFTLHIASQLLLEEILKVGF
jgi:hypothetical protein